MAANAVPDAVDDVWLQFDPQSGHDQAAYRPAVVLSPASYNARARKESRKGKISPSELAEVRAKLKALIG